MGDSLLSGVSGLQAHQQMLDVAGNNLANVNTIGFKSSSVTFAELLSETVKEASQPSATIGGTNPMQVGSGVQVASINRNMTQGSLMSTGQALDMAIEGSGYFVLNDGQKNVYTRVGAFSVDSQYYLVDPGTGYRVQRIGSDGVSDGFQNPASNNIRIPYDVALPSKATTSMSFSNNLSADKVSPTTNTLISGLAYTVDGSVAGGAVSLVDLDQAGGLVDGDKIIISGTRRDGTDVGDVEFDIFNADGTSKTLGELVAAINAAFPDSVATLSSGQLVLTDKESGYSQTDIRMAMDSDAAGAMELPQNFNLSIAGAMASGTTNVSLYDNEGISHTMTVTFVKTHESNKWDMVINSVDGNVELIDRRIKGITFLTDGTFGGTGSNESAFNVVFGSDPGNVRKINVFLGDVGGRNGITQFGGDSTVSSSGQNGYAAGWLSTMSVSRDGVLVGIFTNGVRKDLAALKVATFQNPAGLTSLGNNFFIASSNSGEAVPAKALTGGAGAVRGGVLEKSNVEVATEFVNLIQAQNGYQANARTIKVANDMLRELTDLIR